MDKLTFRNISVFGGGLMGTGIGQIFAGKGFNVTIYDVIPSAESQALQKIESNLKIMLENGIGSEETITSTLEKIIITDDLKTATQAADLVIESIPENMEMKQNLFKDLDQLCKPHAILATNTSVMSITEIAQKVRNKERVLGTHFWNPPFLIPLVEVIKAEHTSDDVMTQIMDLLKIIGKHPVRVKKDVPGFVANRLQHALWREAISIVERGIADAATVDESIKYGFGLRLPVLAPMENADMVGTDLTLAIHSYLLKHLENSTEPSPLLQKKVEKRELGFKTGEGFQKWSTEEAEQSRKKLLEYLINITRNH